MKKSINTKHLVFEFIRNKKIILCFGVTIAILCTVFSWISTAHQLKGQQYGAYGELYVVRSVGKLGDMTYISEDVQQKNIYNDLYSDVYIMIDNTLLSEVSQNINEKDIKLSAEKIREMIHIDTDDFGRKIELTIVADNESVAVLVCQEVLDCLLEKYTEQSLNAEVRTGAQNIGAVIIESQDSTLEQGKQIETIKPIQNNTVSFSFISKKFIMGFIIGIVLGWAGIIIVYVVRNRIIYVEQLDEVSGTRLLGDINKCSWMDIYSNLLLKNKTIKTVNIISLNVDNSREIVEKFVLNMDKLGKKVIIINCLCGADNENIIFEDEKIYKYININNQLVVNEHYVNSIINEYKKEYDYILLCSFDVEQTSIMKIVSLYTDETILLLKANTITEEKLVNLNESLLSENKKENSIIFV